MLEDRTRPLSPRPLRGVHHAQPSAKWAPVSLFVVPRGPDARIVLGRPRPEGTRKRLATAHRCSFAIEARPSPFVSGTPARMIGSSAAWQVCSLFGGEEPMAVHRRLR